jgi:hypothetical protein
MKQQDVIDARSSAIEGARMLGDEIGNYMELQRTLLAKEQQDAKKSKRKKVVTPLLLFPYLPCPFYSPITDILIISGLT